MDSQYPKRRARLPVLQKKAQLSNCSQGALGAPVVAAMTEYNQSWLEKGMDWTGWMDTVHAAKSEFARLIRADAADIAVPSSASDDASSISNALEFTQNRAGMHMLNALDMAQVVAYTRHLSAVAPTEVKRDGLRCASASDLSIKGPSTAIYVDDAREAEQKVAQAGFIVSARSDVIRLALHIYNTKEKAAATVHERARHA